MSDYAFIIALTVLLIGLPIACNQISKAECNAKWESFQPKYSFFGGCRILVDGNYIPDDNYRSFSLEP